MKKITIIFVIFASMAMGAAAFGQTLRPKMVPVQFLPADASEEEITSAIVTCEALVGPDRLLVGPVCEAFRTPDGDIMVRPTALQRARL